jgi:DNA polymerase III epsilon subunit-like protein
MVIKPESVNGGKKIVLRHVSGSKKGELAGSIPTEGASGISALSDIPRAPLSVVEPVETVEGAYEKFVQVTKTATDSPIVDEAANQPQILIDPSVTPVSLSRELSLLLPTGLEADQHEDIMGVLDRKKWSPKPADPTEEEWQRYLLVARARLTDPVNGLTDDERADALARWDQVAASGTPDGVTFAVMNSADSRSWRSMYALNSQALQIASWVDADADEVKAAIAGFRAEYYQREAAGEDVKIPEQYTKSWKRLMDGSPKDPATIYSHYKAENPALYLNPVQAKRYIALDLETTGLSTQDCHIIEVGLVEYDADGTELGRWNRLVRPPADADGNISTGPDEVFAVHKISVADVIDAPSFADILPELQGKLAGATIIGHNLGFDTKHLKVSMKKYAPADNPDLAVAPWTGEADTMFHASRHMTGLENNKLVTVSGSLGIPYTNGHRAEHDAAVSGEVFFEIRKSLKAAQARAIADARASGFLPETDVA